MSSCDTVLLGDCHKKERLYVFSTDAFKKYSPPWTQRAECDPPGTVPNSPELGLSSLCLSPAHSPAPPWVTRIPILGLLRNKLWAVCHSFSTPGTACRSQPVLGAGLLDCWVDLISDKTSTDHAHSKTKPQMPSSESPRPGSSMRAHGVTRSTSGGGHPVPGQTHAPGPEQQGGSGCANGCGPYTQIFL